MERQGISVIGVANDMLVESPIRVLLMYHIDMDQQNVTP
jgi:hypothetical protein